MVINGKQLASEILTNLKQRVAALPFTPVFCDVLVGSDPVSLSYVKIKGKTAEAIGIQFLLEQLPAVSSQADVVGKIQELNLHANISGLIVQLPLPRQLDREAVLEAVDPQFDVDCLGSVNSQKFYSGQSVLAPPTAAAILHILRAVTPDLVGTKVAVVGQGNLVGRPVRYLLERLGADVVAADKNTSDLRSLLQSADVIVSGTGRPHLITGEMVKKGAIVIDAGTAESAGGIAGDVDFQSVSLKAGYISPVPGGVGPVTVAKLFENVVTVAERSR